MVHWDRKRYRSLLIGQVVLLFMVTTAMIWSVDHNNERLEPVPTLEVSQRRHLPIKELSGLSRIAGARDQLLAVGDRQPHLVEWSLVNPDQQPNVLSFARPMVERFSLCMTAVHGSCEKYLKHLLTDWEAVATDAQGRRFVVQEHSEAIVVFDKQLTKVERMIYGMYHDAFAKIVKNSTRKFKVNALGEGLILLKNGHFLLAKEKYPPSIVEFGPADDQPMGLSASTMLGSEESFQFQSDEFRQRYEALHFWVRGGHSKCDISEITASPTGRLYLLSQNCGQIMELPHLAPNTTQLRALRTFNLPREVVNPEALLALDDWTFVVGSDRKDDGDNVFLVRRPQTELSLRRNSSH